MSASIRANLTRLIIVVGCLVAGVCGIRTHAIWAEYYGAGPPYYGRTVNMDKWESPVIELTLSIAASALLVAGSVYALFRERRHRG